MSSTIDSFPPPSTEPVTGPAVQDDPDHLAPEEHAPAPQPVGRHHAGHIVAIVLGVLALFPGFGMAAGGTTLAIAQGVATSDGYFTFTPDRIESDGVAVITDDAWLDGADDGAPWVFDWLDLDIRLRVDGARSTDDVFVGVARTADVEDYLGGAGYSIVDEIDGRQVRYREQPGIAAVAAPADQDIWVAATDGAGEQEVTWEARGGRWSIVVMNADGSPGVATDVQVGLKSDAVTPVAVVLIVFGGLTLLTGIGLIVWGARGRRTR